MTKPLVHSLSEEIVYDNLVVPDGTFCTIRSLSGNAHVGRRAKLVVKGACYGNVDVDEYGSVLCESVSGNVRACNYTTVVVVGSCYRDVVIGDGGSFECQSMYGDYLYAGRGTILVCKDSCYGNVSVGVGGSFRCKSLFGDIVIGKDGFWECKESMSGGIKNEGGRYSIAGSFYGDEASPVSRNEIICPECGTSNAEDASDCVACGRALHSMKKVARRQSN